MSLARGVTGHAEIDSAIIILFLRSSKVQLRKLNFAACARGAVVQHIAEDSVILHLDAVAVARHRHGGRWTGSGLRLGGRVGACTDLLRRLRLLNLLFQSTQPLVNPRLGAEAAATAAPT